MDQQNAELEKRLEKLEQEFSELRKRLDDLAPQAAIQRVPKNEKKPKGKLFLRICIPILIVCLLTGGFFYYYYLASQKPSYAKAEIGDIVTFGRYEQNNSEADGQEPIEWVVLDKQDDKILLLSRYTLSFSTFSGTSWRFSGIRKSLNSSFMSSAFLPDEQTMISSTSIQESGYDCSDKIVLLSSEEVENYCLSHSFCKSEPTSSVIALNKTALAYSWLLRSVHNDGVLYVNENGVIASGSDIMPFGIRPALWLEVTK